jgi:hypothetical protein
MYITQFLSGWRNPHHLSTEQTMLQTHASFDTFKLALLKVYFYIIYIKRVSQHIREVNNAVHMLLFCSLCCVSPVMSKGIPAGSIHRRKSQMSIITGQ